MQAFFDVVRAKFGPLTAGQVAGLNRYIKSTEGLPIRHRAYIMGTVWHETGPEDSEKHMSPRYEIGPRSYFAKYEPGTKLGKALGNTIKGDGYRFRGTGDTQNTGRANFVKLSKALGVDLVAYPEKLLDPELSAKASVYAMTTGLYTGKKLADYSDYENMRRVVNGTDKAVLIAGYAVTFEKALIAAQNQPVEAPKPVPAPSAPQDTKTALPQAPKASGGLWAWFKSLFTRA